MSSCGRPYQDTSFYSTQAPYCLDDYESGCGLRRRRPLSNAFKQYRPRCENFCCQHFNPNLHNKCTCSLRVEPVCNCSCGLMPSLLHKLLSAPYTKLCKKNEKKSKNKQTQTEPQNQNVSRLTIPSRPFVNFNSQPSQPIYYQPIQYQQPVYQQPVYQQPVYQQPPVQHQPQPQAQQIQVQRQPQQILQPLQWISQIIPKNQKSVVSFKVIPQVENGQKANNVIQIVQPPPSVNKQQRRPSLAVESQVNLNIGISKPSSEEEKPINMPVKPASTHPEESNSKNTQSNQVAVSPVKIENAPIGVNIFALQNQGFGAMNTSQGHSQISFGQQQKSQQISYTSQVSKSSKSETRQSVQQFHQMEQKQMAMRQSLDQKHDQLDSSMAQITEQDV